MINTQITENLQILLYKENQCLKREQMFHGKTQVLLDIFI